MAATTTTTPAHPLFQIISEGDDVDAFKQWVEEHPDVDIKALRYEEASILVDAIKQGRKNIFEYLITSGIYYIDAIAGWRGDTAFHLIVGFKRLDWIGFMIQHKANVNFQDKHGYTVLLRLFCSYKFDDYNAEFLDAARQLISYGANVNITGYKGESVLLQAVWYLSDKEKDEPKVKDWESVIDLLIANGANLHIKDKGDRTVIDHVYYSRNALKYFLEQEIPFHISDSKLEEVFCYYVFIKDSEIAELLSKRSRSLVQQ